MTGELVPVAPMNQYEARALIDTIKRDAARTWDNLHQLYRRRAHEALGYDSFAECLRIEFADVGKSRAYQLVNSFRVADEIEAQSTRVDSPLPPVPNEKVARELAQDPAPAEAWADVVEINGDRPTARQARAVVQERKPLKDPATTQPNAEPKPECPTCAKSTRPQNWSWSKLSRHLQKKLFGVLRYHPPGARRAREMRDVYHGMVIALDAYIRDEERKQ